MRYLIAVCLFVFVVGAVLATDAIVWNVNHAALPFQEFVDCPSNDCTPNPAGVPDQDAIDALRSGATTRLRFAPTNPIFTDACDSLGECVDALEASCAAIGDVAFQARLDGETCRGGCRSATGARTRDIILQCN